MASALALLVGAMLSPPVALYGLDLSPGGSARQMLEETVVSGEDRESAWARSGHEDAADVADVVVSLEGADSDVSTSVDEAATECKVTMRRSSDALNVATYFSWYRSKAQFECMSSRPIEGFFRSKNRRRIRTHLRRLEEHGFHAIAAVVYTDPSGESRQALEMRWMLKALREARRLGFGFIPLYDFSIASHLSANLCNVFAGRCARGDVRVTEYNFDRHPVLQKTVLEDLVMIADEFILPFADLDNPSMSTIRFLHDANGDVVLDEHGLPRPEVYIYIPRVWTDDSGFATIASVLDEVTAAYRDRGLGMPAYSLDVLMPLRKPFNPDRVAAFGESAIRITPFFAATDKAENLRELTRQHQKMYRRTERQLERAINRGQIHAQMQIAGGTVVNFDKRGWSACQEGFNSVAWPALKREHWMQALETLVERTTEPTCEETGELPGDRVPFRNGRFIYADEGFEATWLCAELGPAGARYPNRYGCEPLEGFSQLMDLLGEK
jgi:hypothetical protein